MDTKRLTGSARQYAEIKDALKSAYGLDDDDAALLDTLEGETDLQELIATALREAKRREAMSDAMRAIIADGQARKARHDHAADVIRAAVACAMQDAGLKKLELPDMTITMRAASPSVTVVNDAALPDWAWRIKRELDRPAIKARAAELGDAVVMSNGAPSLTIRTK